MFWKLNITPLLCNRLDSFRRPCGWVSSKAAPDTILPIVQWRCRLQSPRSLAFMSCMFAALYTSIGCHQTQHATAFYIWTSPLCSSCACICMSISLCRYRVLILCLYFISSYKYIYIHICIYLKISLYICILYMPITAYYFLYLSRTFLAHVLRPNSFHRCSSFTSHCRNFASLPQKRLRRHARDFHFPACFQVQLTYFHIHVTFSFRSPPWAASTQGRPCWNRRFGFPGSSPKLWFLHFLAQNCTILDRNSWRGLVQRVPITLLNSFMRPFIHCIFPSLQASSPFLQATNNSNRLSPSCSPFLFSNHQNAHSFFRC